jgi:hypothetical protein
MWSLPDGKVLKRFGMSGEVKDLLKGSNPHEFIAYVQAGPSAEARKIVLTAEATDEDSSVAPANASHSAASFMARIAGWKIGPEFKWIGLLWIPVETALLLLGMDWFSSLGIEPILFAALYFVGERVFGSHGWWPKLFLAAVFRVGFYFLGVYVMAVFAAVAFCHLVIDFRLLFGHTPSVPEISKPSSLGLSELGGAGGIGAVLSALRSGKVRVAPADRRIRAAA